MLNKIVVVVARVYLFRLQLLHKHTTTTAAAAAAADDDRLQLPAGITLNELLGWWLAYNNIYIYIYIEWGDRRLPRSDFGGACLALVVDGWGSGPDRQEVSSKSDFLFSISRGRPTADVLPLINDCGLGCC